MLKAATSNRLWNYLVSFRFYGRRKQDRLIKLISEYVPEDKMVYVLSKVNDEVKHETN